MKCADLFRLLYVAKNEQQVTDIIESHPYIFADDDVWVDAMYVIGALLLRIRLKQSRKARRDQRASIHHNATTIYWRARENLIYHYYIVLGVCILRRELTYDDDASHRPRKD